MRSSSSDLGGHGSKCHPPCIGVARIFDWGGKAKITRNEVIRNFRKRNFCGANISYRMEDQKPWPGLALNREFSKGRGFKPKVTNENIVYSNVSQTGIWGRGPKSLGDFLEFFGKKKLF